MPVTSHSDAARTWLREILLERFDIPLQLSDNGDYISLALPGADGKIDILSDLQGFNGKGREICLFWNARVEGYNGPIDETIPAPCAEKLPPSLIERTNVGYRIHYDILGLTYWMLTRTEELGRTDLDEHQRFPAIASHASRHGYLDRPLVDEWLAILGQVIVRQWPQISVKQIRFKVLPSHDVDSPAKYAFIPKMRMARTVVGHVLKRRDFKAAIVEPWIWANSQFSISHLDPYNTFNWLMDQSDRFGLRSAFYFICGSTSPKRDALYTPERRNIRLLMRTIHARGHEVGLHPSYGTYLSPDLIAGEADRLRKICDQENISQTAWGGRMHYLRWHTPITLRAWDEAGMAYDSTMAFPDHAGFRCGTCWEYPGFDPVDQLQLGVRIRPLIVMECTVIDDKYMGLGHTQTAVDYMIKLKDRCKRVNGNFTILWHNSRFIDPQARSMYIEVLDA